MTGMQLSYEQAPSWDECVQILERFPSLPFDSRVQAVERLVRNPSPGIREQALRIGAAILPDSRLTAYLRDDADAVLRNAGCEIFRLRGGRSLPVVVELLRDPDDDVVVQAVLILDRLRDPRALEPLHAILGHADPNVQQEAILAIGRLGDARSIPYLVPFLDSDPWVQMAAVQALGDLRAPAAVPYLAERLTDPLAGSLAAEALARIGGDAAFHALAACWPAAGSPDGDSGVEIEEETLLGLLAHVLEGLPAIPRPLPAGFHASLLPRLQGGSAELRRAAARCLLVLGPSDGDAAALEVLMGAAPPSGGLPPALAQRGDLIGPLLRLSEVPRSWGFLLAARFPDQAPAEEFLAALDWASEDPNLLPPLARALETVRFPGLDKALLGLYLWLPLEQRELLEPALEAHGAELRATLAGRSEVDDLDRLILSAWLGLPTREVVAAILALPGPSRQLVASRLMRLEAVIRQLPWEEWLHEAPELFATLAAEAASRYNLRALLPALRARAAAVPGAALVRALGDLADREAVPVLLRLLAARIDLRPVILESLGRIGGAAARAALREAVLAGGEGAEERIAYRALAACAGAGDDALFRQATLHPDWYVRLASVDVLARFKHPENMAALVRLVADPAPAVAHRALALFES